MAWLSTFILILAVAVLSPAAEASFSAKLIHRDNQQSPLHDSAATRYERQQQAFLRSFSRSKYLKSRISGLGDATPADFQSEITPNSGEFLMEAAIGTPPFTIQAIADTGSDLTWTQCSPCTSCYKQTAPLFKPSGSKTYRKIACSAKQCRNADHFLCVDDTYQYHCQYQFYYGDKSHTIGDLAADTLTFKSGSGRNVSIPAVVIGCGFDNSGTFNEKGSGIIGLGAGPLSIIKQLDKQVQGKFSYCLGDTLDVGSSSKISFGAAAVVSGPKTVSTPLLSKSPPLDSFYFLTLEEVTVANATSSGSRKKRQASDSGNIIIDSGSTLTLLPQDIYDALESDVKSAVTAPIAESPTELLKLCYSATGVGREFPSLVAHFTGADVAVPASSAFVEASEGVFCLSFVPAIVGLQPIYGNLAQQNYQVGYDTKSQKLSFQPKDCSKAT